MELHSTFYKLYRHEWSFIWPSINYTDINGLRSTLYKLYRPKVEKFGLKSRKVLTLEVKK